MKRKRNWMQRGAVVFLLLSLLLPAFSGALAEGEQAAGEQAVVIPIKTKTELLNDAGKPIGTLLPGEDDAVSLQLKSGETITGVSVSYLPSTTQEEVPNKALAGKTKVLLSIVTEALTPNPMEPSPAQSPEQTPTPIPKKTPAELPAEGWIDTSIVLSAVNAQLEQAKSTLVAAVAELTALKSVTPAPTEPVLTATPVPENGSSGGIFSPDRAAAWLPLAAVALGIVGVGMLAWIAFSAFSASSEARHQTDQLKKLSDELNTGIEVKSPVKVVQAAWPREGRITIASEALELLAARPVYVPIEAEKSEDPPAPPPKIVPPGEDPELLALCNRLAGVASAEKWHSIVKEAGWHAVLSQTNPTEKGTYIPDESGYSIVACLMRDADADIAFVLPSYQDPNASEERWSEFFTVSEDLGVKNFRVDALAEMFIERGTFFLLKSKGRLTHRPQFF